jgi:hypothetical protein
MAKRNLEKLLSQNKNAIFTAGDQKLKLPELPVRLAPIS